MASPARVPGSASSLSRWLFPPGQLLLADRSCQELPPICTDENITASVLAQHPKPLTEPPEAINAAVPQVSCCLMEASMALSEKRTEDLCAHLAQASSILTELLGAVAPERLAALPAEPTQEFAAEREQSATAAVPPTAEHGSFSPIEIERAMAMAV